MPTLWGRWGGGKEVAGSGLCLLLPSPKTRFIQPPPATGSPSPPAPARPGPCCWVGGSLGSDRQLMGSQPAPSLHPQRREAGTAGPWGRGGFRGSPLPHATHPKTLKGLGAGGVTALPPPTHEVCGGVGRSTPSPPPSQIAQYRSRNVTKPHKVREGGGSGCGGEKRKVKTLMTPPLCMV